MGEIAEALKKANAERELEQEQERAAEPPAPPMARELPQTPASPPRQGSVPQPQAAQLASAPISGSVSSVVAASAAAAAAPTTAQISQTPPAEQELLQSEYGKDQIDLHRHLALRIRSELERRKVGGFSVVSALRDEGKTTVACSLAMALASISPERNVALIDLDLRSPSVAARLGLQPSIGIEAVIHGQADLDSIRLSLDHPALDVYPAHDPQRAAHELLVEASFADVIRELQRRYSILVIDTPPTLLVPDSTLILRHLGACIAVATIGSSRVRRFNDLIAQLPEHQIIGKVLNGTPPPKHQQDYYYAYGPDDKS